MTLFILIATGALAGALALAIFLPGDASRRDKIIAMAIGAASGAVSMAVLHVLGSALI